MQRARSGFVVHELLAAAGILAVVGAIAVVMAGAARSGGGAGDTLNNLRRLSGSYASWAADHADEFATFTWRAGENDTQYADLRFSGTDLEAAANQAVDILRRRSGRDDIPKFSGWIPHILYNYLILADAMEWGLPDPGVISPDDVARRCWQESPTDYCGCPVRPADCNSSTGRRWPFSSSYVLPPMFYSPDSGSQAIYQNGTHNTYLVPSGVPFGGKLYTQVAFPSDKAHLFDSHGRSSGIRQAYFMYEEARVPIVRVDGSAAYQTTSESNRGWQPASPRSQSPLQVRYEPTWEPPKLVGIGDIVFGHYMYSRRGLGGRDFDGPELPSN